MTDHSLVSIDLAKTVFQVWQFSDDNTILSNNKVSRRKLSQEIAQLSPTTVVMEACYSAHY
jgi:transposase